jgi:hypothetical protein
MGNANHKDDDCFVLNFADHAIVADAVAPEFSEWTAQSFT